VSEKRWRRAIVISTQPGSLVRRPPIIAAVKDVPEIARAWRLLVAPVTEELDREDENFKHSADKNDREHGRHEG
jgi:hypothetical protein